MSAEELPAIPPGGVPAAGSAKAAALEHIRREHRALAQVNECLQSIVAEAGEHNVAPDFQLLATLLYYVDAFPERVHHPKEDRYLFTALQRRDPNSIQLLARLRSDHERSPALIAALEVALVHWQSGAPDAVARFVEALQTYCDHHWAHIRIEETELLPRAEQALTTADWIALAEAFSGNEDPLFGPRPTDELMRIRRLIDERARREPH